MSLLKVVLLPVHPPKLHLIKKTLWSLSHVKGIYVKVLCHRCSESEISDIKKYQSFIELLDISNDNTDANLSVRLNRAKVGFGTKTVFYRLDAGDIIHIDRFSLFTENDILITHHALIKYPNRFDVVKYRGLISQLFRNRLVHSSFIFSDSEYDEGVTLAQDYVLSLFKILVKKHTHINRVLVLKDMTQAGNTKNNRRLSIKGTIYAKKKLLSKLVYVPSVLIDYIKLCLLKSRT